MDTLQVKDILPKIFSYLFYDINYLLVCKFWNKIYKYSIASKNIVIISKKNYINPGQNIEIYSLNVNNSSIENFYNFANIRFLTAFNCQKLYTLESLGNNLTMLDISRCKKLTELPKLINLEYLIMHTCKNIKDIKILENSRKLKELDISRSYLIEYVPYIENLEKLNAYSCKSLTNIAPISTLKYLDISNCELIIKLPILQNIETLYAYKCENLVCINGISNKIKYIYAYRSKNIKKIPNLN